MPNRYMTRPSIVKDDDGFKICKGVECDKRIPRGRRCYCSDVCHVDTDVRCGFAVTHHVYERDKGVCAKCDLDTAKLGRIARHLLSSQKESGHFTTIWMQKGEVPDWMKDKATPTPQSSAGNYLYRPPRWDHWLISHPAIGITKYYQVYWEADHIVPVSERPARDRPCGLDGYQTLCQRCHAKETAALRKRLAKRQRCHICGRPRKLSRLTRRPCMCKAM